MGKSLYGSALRADKNKSKRKNAAAEVRAAMPHLIAAGLPAVLEKPVNGAALNAEVKSFQSFLREEYPDITRLRVAFSELADFIAAGNSGGGWKLDIPPTITSISRTTSSRNYTSFKAGIDAGKLYQGWMQKQESEKHLPCPEDRLADVLISAVFYGGLANSRAVTSLANVLISEPKPLQFAGDNSTYAWVELILSGDSDPLNHKVVIEDGTNTSWQALHRFYLDNRTLGQILNFQYVRARKEIKELGELDQVKAWEMIKNRMISGSQKKPITSLGAFCQGAQTITETLTDVELPQALLECAAGRVGTVSLPPKYLQNWFLKNLDAAAAKTFSLRDAQGGAATKGAKEQGARSSRRHAGETTPIDMLLKQIRSALQPEVGGEKNTPPRAIKQLEAIAQEHLPLNAVILVDWLVDSLATRKIKVASASRYFSELARPWLFHTNEADIDDMDESELEQIYRQILAFKPGDDNQALNYLQGRLQDLHRFACESGEYGLPELTGFFDRTSETQTQSQVRAGYIPEHSYQAMLRSLERLTGTDPDTREGLAVLLILAYRTGMRRGELLKLRLSDIEKSDEHWIYVVNNRYGNNKSDSARRRIPVYLLLLPSELARFRQYLQKRRAKNQNHTNTLLFSEPHAVTMPHHGSLVSGLTKTLLTFQGLDGLSFHHLRHSALTSLLVVMEEIPELITTLTGYSLEQAKQIRSELFCSNPLCSRDKYSAIAGLAGHLSPDTTFLHYFHETSLLVWKRLAMYDPVLDKEQLSRLSGLSTQAINTHLQDKGGTTRLSSMRAEMLKRLAPMSRRLKVKGASTAAIDDTPDTLPKIKFTVSDCYAVLRDLEKGDPVSMLSKRHKIDESKLDQWFEAANKIQRLTTKTGNRRHFPKKMNSTVIGIPLAPIRPQDRATAAETDKVINLLREAYAEDRVAITWCIDYWKNNTSQTKSGTRFTRVDDAARFIASLDGVIRKSRWELRVMVAPKVTLDELQVWKELGISCQLQEAAQGRTIQAYLRLRHIKEQEVIGKRQNIKQFSSQLLNYVFHMLAIMVDGRRVS